jgi:hypothetical protein
VSAPPPCASLVVNSARLLCADRFTSKDRAEAAEEPIAELKAELNEPGSLRSVRTPSSVLLRAVSLILFRAVGLRLVLIDNSLQTRDVLQQTLGDQPQEVIAELRIPEVDFE